MNPYVDRRTFFDHVRQHEYCANAGSITQYDSLTESTRWSVAGKLVGVSGGKIGESTWYKIVQS